MLNLGKLSATIYVPFGAGTMENDPRAVGTTRNCTAGTGYRQKTSARAKERNRKGRLLSAGWLRRRRGFMSPSKRRPRFLEPSRRRRVFLEIDTIGPKIKHMTYLLPNIRQIRRGVYPLTASSS